MTPPVGEYPEEGTRAGIPSIPASAIRWFYALFSIGTVYLTVANTLKETAGANAIGWLEVQSIATVQLVQSAGASAAGAAIIVEGGHMVLAAIFKVKNRRQAKEAGLREGREEGRQQVQASWEDWNRRRVEAEAKGEPFTEPPPGSGSYQ